MSNIAENHRIRQYSPAGLLRCVRRTRIFTSPRVPSTAISHPATLALFVRATLLQGSLLASRHKNLTGGAVKPNCQATSFPEEV